MWKFPRSLPLRKQFEVQRKALGFFRARPSGTCSCKDLCGESPKAIRPWASNCLQGPRGERQGMWRTKFGKSPGEGGILPVYLLTTFCSHFAAKFSMQIVNNPMQTVCISAGYFRSIHLFRTVGDSSLILIINEFGRLKGSCLRSTYGRKIAVRIM